MEDKLYTKLHSVIREIDGSVNEKSYTKKFKKKN